MNPGKLDQVLEAALAGIDDRSVNAFAFLAELNLSVDARLRVLVEIDFQGSQQVLRDRIEELNGRAGSVGRQGPGTLQAQIPIRSLPVLAEERFVTRIRSVSTIAAAVPPSFDLDPPTRQIPERALEAIRSALIEKQTRTAAQRKLDSGLLLAAKRSRNLPVANGALSRVQPTLTQDQTARVLVAIELVNVDESVSGLIGRLGGRVVGRVDRFRYLQAWVPLQQIETLAQHGSIRSIKRAIDPVTRIRNRSEGDVRHRVDRIRGEFGYNGTGVKVGVISNGVDGLVLRQVAGELPDNIEVLPGQFGVGAEGTAMLEIVNDLAPGAELMFASGFPSEAQMAQNILDLAAEGCDIIVDDVGHLLASVFQDGPAAMAVESVVQQGVAYFSAAGNSGNFDGGTSGVWEGDFKASTLTIDGEEYIVHEFSDGVQFNELRDDPLSVIALQWTDPMGASNNDYDLLLLDESGTEIVAISDNIQDGQGDPIEFIDSRIEDHGWYRIVIVKASGQDRYLRLDTFGSNIEFVTAGQVFGHPAAESAIAIGAVYQGEGQFGPGCFDGDERVESFSSDGPRRMFFDATGQPYTPADMSASGGVVRSKPDFVAADGVSTNTPFFEQFFGTSAAAPHAAAIGALLKQRGVDDPKHIRALLEATAIDVEVPGFDRKSGHGIIDAFRAMISPLAIDDVLERVFEPEMLLNESSLIDNDLAGVANGSLTLSSVSSVTDAGGIVSYENGWVRYQPVPGFVGMDRFEYTVSESGGSAFTGAVEVHVLAPTSVPLRLSVHGHSNAGLMLHIEGDPGREVLVEKSVGLDQSDAWVSAVAVTLDETGEGDLLVEAEEAHGFFRLRTDSSP